MAMSFRLKTILGIALIETALLLVLVVSGLSFLHTSNEEQLLDRASITSRLFVDVVKDAVLSSDLALIESFVSEIQANSDVAYVRIRDIDGRILAEGGSSALLRQVRMPDNLLEGVDDGVFDAVAMISESGIDYGQVEFGLSIDEITEVLAEARSQTISIAIAEVVLVALFSYVLGSYLTRGLQQLNAASRAIVEVGPGHQVEVSSHDEVGDVARAFNHMSSTLKRQHEQLAESLNNSRAMLEKSLHERLKNEAILSSSLDAIVSINDEGRIVDFNAVAEQMFGWRLAEVEGHPMHRYLIPEAFRDAHLRGMEHYLKTGEGPVLNQRIQLTALHRDGHTFPVEMAIADTRTPDGLLFTAFLRDVTQQIADQTELRLAAAAFETIEPMLIADSTARIVRVNEALLRSTGYQENELIGHPCSLLSSGQQSNEFYASMWTQLLASGSWSGQIFNQRKNGEVFPELLSISAVRDGDGAVSHYIAHYVDISEQIEREKALQLATDYARRADQAKSRFLAVMSHEIRTPMNAVLGTMELLGETELQTKQRELIDRGYQSGKLLLSVINDVLEFSRMEAGLLHLAHEVFDLHQALSQCAEIFHDQVNAKGIELILHLDDDVPRYVKGDKGRLQQVLVNLIGNAVKFTDRGEINVSIKQSALDGNAVQLFCEVEDTGQGILPADQMRLFQEFVMADQSYSRNSSGTGLGLAISKRIVEAMSGKIAVNSDPGRGSRFFFDVRLEVAAPDESREKQPASDIIGDLSGKRILLAEDNHANQQVFKAMLMTTGLHVDFVFDGLQAVEAVARKHYDLILMDMSMPLMDGMSATRKIRKLAGKRAAIPIIALTAHNLQGDEESFREAGASDYLAKPVTKRDLLHTIWRWIGREREDVDLAHAQSLDDVVESDHHDADSKSAQGLVDESVIQKLIADTSVDIIADLLRGYLDDTRQRMSRIEEAAKQKDVNKLQFEVHALGSSAATYANLELHRLARMIEHAAKQGKNDDALQAVPDLQAVADASLEGIEERLRQGFA
jgi:PAS domain S-box-containing protein